MSFRTSEFTEIASGLGYPESPVPLSDGGFLVVDIKAGSLIRYRLGAGGNYLADPSIDLHDPSGKLGSGPNGAAIGPDGCVYVCNDGGKQFLEIPLARDGVKWTLSVTGDAATNYAGGYIQRVHLDTGKVEIWCAPDSVGAAVPDCSKETHPRMNLSSPDDIIFDSTGGFWFTDWGNSCSQKRKTDCMLPKPIPDGSSTGSCRQLAKSGAIQTRSTALTYSILRCRVTGSLIR